MGTVPTVLGRCVCGKVRIEIDFPGFWAWHDHSTTTQHAHGAASATYVGSWKSRFRITSGSEHVTRFADKTTKTSRTFCARCGTPLTYERGHSPKMVNIPRPLFLTRTGREPRYHIALEQTPDWAYTGAKLDPLKGYPGVLWERPKKPPKIKRNQDTVLPPPNTVIAGLDPAIQPAPPQPSGKPIARPARERARE